MLLRRDRVRVVEQDISAIKDPDAFWQDVSGEVDKPDLIFGDPPCQAFSQAGKQKGLQDDRGGMINEFLRFVSDLRSRRRSAAHRLFL